MPMIRILGTRWNFASDDLVIICLSDAVWRSVISLILLIGLIVSGRRNASSEVSVITSCGVLLSLELFSVCGLFLISYLATKGSVLDVNKRLPATALFTWRLVVLMPLEMVVVGVAINTMVTHHGNRLIPWMSVSIALSFAAVVTTITLAFVAFDPTVWVKKSSRLDWITWLWHMRIVTTAKCCCLYSPDISNTSLFSAYEGVAHTLSRPFSQHDLVASDAMAGIILLAAGKDKPIKTFASMADETPVSWMTVENARRYCCHALSIYSWPIYVYLNSDMRKGVKWLMNEYIRTARRNPFNRRNSSAWQHLFQTPEYGGRSYSLLDLKAFRLLLPDAQCKLCYLDLDNKLFRTPFSIVVDEKEKSIVVVIRGTMSMRDVFTDACAVNHDFSYKGINGKCHYGMLQVTEQVMKELMKNDLLKRITGEHQGYQLILCGHSLGAGAATLITMRLRESGYPNAICYAFSSPKSVTENLAIACNEFCFALTVGHDIIARLGLWSLEHLKSEMVEALAACPLPKYRIFYNVLLDKPVPDQDHIEDDMYNTVLKDSLLMTAEPAPEEVQLHVPGVILHVDPAPSKDDVSRSGPSCRIMPRCFFMTISVHPRMFLDHMPHVLLNSLMACVP